MSDTEIILQGCSSNIEILKRQLEEELSKKEELEILLVEEKSENSLDKKIKIIETAINDIKIQYKVKKLHHYLTISQSIGTFNTLCSKTSYSSNIIQYHYRNNFKEIQTKSKEEFNKLYGEIIRTEEFINILNDDLPNFSFMRGSCRHHDKGTFKKISSTYEKEIAIYDSLKIISERLDKIECVLGM